MNLNFQNNPIPISKNSQPISMGNHVLLEAQKRHRRHRRNRAIADLKDGVTLLFMMATCVGVIYFLGIL